MICVTLQSILKNSNCSVSPLYKKIKTKGFSSFILIHPSQVALSSCQMSQNIILHQYWQNHHPLLVPLTTEQVSQSETVIWCWLWNTSMTSCLMGGISGVTALPVVTMDLGLLSLSQFFSSWSGGQLSSLSTSGGRKKVGVTGIAPPWAIYSLASEADLLFSASPQSNSPLKAVAADEINVWQQTVSGNFEAWKHFCVRESWLSCWPLLRQQGEETPRDGWSDAAGPQQPLGVATGCSTHHHRDTMDNELWIPLQCLF